MIQQRSINNLKIMQQLINQSMTE